MSDFDEEAERERLREKYERDQRKREATEQMSDLLLKGATMTNAHCGECGDPIFRYDGQEFCPSCETVVGADQAADETPGAADGTAEDGTDGDSAAETGAATPDESAATAQNAVGPSTAPETDHTTTAADPASTGSDEHSQAPDSRRVPSVAAEGDSPATEGSLADAQESLVRTLTRFAREAEAVEDPGRSGDYLVAVEQAADALAAVRRADE